MFREKVRFFSPRLLLIQSQQLVAVYNTLFYSLNHYHPNLAARIFSLDNYNNSTKLLNDLTVSSILFLITYGIQSSYCLKDQLQSVIHLSLFLPLLSLIFSPFWPLAIPPPCCFSNIPRVLQTQSLHVVFPLPGSTFPRPHMTCTFMLFRSLFKCYILRILSPDHVIPITPESLFPSLLLQP